MQTIQTKLHSPTIRSSVQVALTQMSCSADPQDNLHRQVGLIERAISEGGHMVCTQELFRSQYFCQVEDHRFFELAETIPGPGTEALCAIARRSETVIIASLF